MCVDAREEAPFIYVEYTRGEAQTVTAAKAKYSRGTHAKVRKLARFQRRLEHGPIHTPTASFCIKTPRGTCTKEQKSTEKVDDCEQQRQLRVRVTIQKSVSELVTAQRRRNTPREQP